MESSVDDTYDLRRDLYIDFWMNIYDMNTPIKRDPSLTIPDINIRQYDDGHVSTMSILKSFSVSGQWCITGTPAALCIVRRVRTVLPAILADSHLSSDNER